MKNICFVLTAEFAVKAFLLNHLRALSKIYDVTVIVNTNNPNFLAEAGIRANVIPISISREISLFSDISCLVKLIKIFRHKHFSSIHSVTPKAGLLAMLAAYIVRIPLRVHTFTGQVWANKTGFRRTLLKQLDVLIAWLTTVNIVDSPSQCKFLLDEKVLASEKVLVFGDGSISGVDLSRFKPNIAARFSIRKQLIIADHALLFLFLGRLTQDKGVLDLAQAFSELNAPDVHLVFVGSDEQNLKPKIKSITKSFALFVHFIGYTNTPEQYMAAADVLCLPSYREGFGSVLIEAAAVGVPSIASRIYGITDAVLEGKTGLLHTPMNVAEIKTCMESMISNSTMRLYLAEQAKTRANELFDSNLLTNAWMAFYQKNLD